MKEPLRHLPLGLVLFLILFLGATDWAIGVDSQVLITLLAPVLWVGWYVLGSNHATEKEA